jgi:hypothetical protein
MGKVMKAEYIHELVNPLGLDGWELVAIAPVYYEQDEWVDSIAVGVSAVTKWNATMYRAIFKRKLP